MKGPNGGYVFVISQGALRFGQLCAGIFPGQGEPFRWSIPKKRTPISWFSHVFRDMFSTVLYLPANGVVSYVGVGIEFQRTVVEVKLTNVAVDQVSFAGPLQVACGVRLVVFRFGC